MRLVQSFLEFVAAVIAQWATLVTGGVVVAVLTLWEKRHKPIPWHTTRWIFLAFLFIAIFLAWEDAHRTAVGAGESIVALKAKLEEERQDARDKDRQITNLGTQGANLSSQIVSRETGISNRDNALTNRDAQLTIRDQQISALQQQIQDEHKVTSELQLRLDKAREAEPERTTALEIPAPGKEVQALHYAQFMVLTNRAITPVRRTLVCRGAFKTAGAGVLGLPNMSSGGDEGKIAPNAYRIAIITPAWTPTAPLLVTVFYDGDDPLPCNLRVQ
jgi:hypothetical protein